MESASKQVVVERALPNEAIEELDAAMVLAAAREFASFLAIVDRGLRRSACTVPDADQKLLVASAFANLIATIQVYGDSAQGESGTASKEAVMAIVGQWLWRSRLFNRFFHKPHGYAGDYAMIEALYDLETSAGVDATQPAVANCLDHVLTTLDCTRSIWERRRWIAGMLRDELGRRSGRLRILDVACGGARYIADFLDGLGDADAARVEVVLVDQDAAAIAFCRERSLARWSHQLSTHAVPLATLPALLGSQRFDVVLSAGLLDYLDTPYARALVSVLTGALEPQGLLAISNFYPDAPTRIALDWTADWRLIYRTEEEVRRLFPSNGETTVRRGENRALVLGSWRRSALHISANQDVGPGHEAC